MRVRVLFFGVLKEVAGRSEEEIETSPQTTIASLFDSYRQRFATLDARRSSILFARNREFATPDTILSDGDEVAFLPPVSGGSASATQAPLVSITRDVIDVRALADQIRAGCDGAVITFEGVVRDNTKGRQTTHLEYESYEPLAIAQMERVAAEITRQFSVTRIGVIHRLGTLQIGEASVVIVVGSPHRRAAFQAALETIDRLKREVPIWKKEFFSDGEVWVEGEWDEALRSQSFNHESR